MTSTSLSLLNRRFRLSLINRFLARPYWPLLPLCFGVFIAADDQTVVVTLLPEMLIDLEVSATEVGSASWTITGYLIGFTAAMPLMGRFSDRIGHRLAFTVAMSIFMIGSALVALSLQIPEWFGQDGPGLEWMVGARVIQAIGGGAIIPIAIAAAGDVLPGSRVLIAYAIVGASAEAGGVIGPLWGGLLTEFASWEWAFWLNLPFGLVAMGLVLRMPSGVRRPVDVDVVGGVLFGLSLALLTAGLSFSGERGVWFYLLLATSLVAIAILVARLRSAESPIVPRSLLATPSFLAVNSFHLLIGASLIIAMITIPLMANTVQGKSSLDGGLQLLRMTAAIPVGAIAGGLLTQRFGTHSAAISGIVLTVVGFALMSGWGADIGDPALTIHLVVVGLGFGLLIAPVTASAMRSAIPGTRGAASSFVTVSRMTGMTIGLAAIAAWGTTRFDTLVADAPAFSTDPAVQQQIADLAQSAGLDVFQKFFLAAAIMMAIGIIPALLMGRNDSRDQIETD